MIATESAVVIMSRAELTDLIRSAAQEAAKLVAGSISQQDDELWDAEKVAAYLGMAEGTVAAKLAYQRGFPPAVVLGDGPKARRRWMAAEIKEWAGRQRERRAA